MKKIYSLALALLSTAAFAQTFTATYDFGAVTATSGTTDPTPVPTASNVTFGSFTAVNPAAAAPYNSSGGGRFSFNNMPLGGAAGSDDYSAMTGSIDLTRYYQVSMAPALGFRLDLTSIGFRVQRSGTGIRTYAVRTSADNYATNLGTITIDPANPVLSTQPGNIFFWVTDAITQGQNGSKINVTSINDLVAPLTVRFYGWNADAEGGTFSIDDVAFTGNIEPLIGGLKDNSIAGLSMYPNPLTGNVLNITSTANADKAVAIFDVLGKQVINTKVTNGTVNVSGLNSGVYIVKITEEGKTATRKLVIK
ncbi:MAG: T9SS type A sorting domain-containing protein [Pedobacter sp.]|nr:MAG: T9SS type A sorting domain-containing protein [Pedobacter sp.]